MHDHVGAAVPVAPWLGGKSKLAKTIIARLEQIPHETYVEPFVGMGGVFLRRAYRPKSEVVNDANGEIINLFRMLQRHHGPLLDLLQFQISSRAEYERLRVMDPAVLTDLERAARFLYLQRLGFGGRLDAVFGVAKERRARFNPQRVEPLLRAAHARMSGVTLECLDWQDVLARYDGAQTLFYLDPPYYGSERDYGDGFGSDQFETMAALLAQIKGAFVLSLNDVPEIRALFEWAVIDDLRLTYTIKKEGPGTRAAELLISNRSLRAGLL